MALPADILLVMNSPGMYYQRPNIESTIAFLNGYDVACQGGLLTGFREWIIPQLGFGGNLSWGELVCLRIREVCGINQVSPLGNNPELVTMVFDALKQFYLDKEKPQGMIEIYKRYSDWLANQS